MDIFKLGRIFKGEEYDITLTLPFSGVVDNFQLYFFTDSANTVDISYQSLVISGNVATIKFNETTLDVLNDGVLNYYMKYSQDGKDYIQCTNTMHYLKSPADYNPKTTQDIYNDGYEAGLSASTGDYSTGYFDGEAAQKAKLSGITITSNGTYSREDGFSSVLVLIQSGQTFQTQSKNYSITANGNTIITVDDGYDGITGGTISVNVPSSGHSDAEITEAFNSGYTGGQEFQKTLMTTITATTNGTYARDNGYSSFEVNVAQTGYTDYDLAVSYNNGYNDGETYGETVGAANQKALLSSITITENGIYSRDNGYSRVMVNVPQTGVTPVLETLNVTPTTSQQTITPTGNTDGYNQVNVAAVTSSIDSNITSANIREGVSVLGVTGALSTNGCYIWTGSQAQYDALQSYDNNTVYLIV